MLTEKQIEKKFYLYANKIIKKLGTRATSDSQLNIEGKLLFGNKFKGCYSQDSKHTYTNGFYIINTDLESGGGVHWITMVVCAKNAYIYDTYGRPSSKLLSHLVKKLKQRNIKHHDSDKDVEQSKTSQICGPLCLAWLCIVKELGVKSAMKI